MLQWHNETGESRGCVFAVRISDSQNSQHPHAHFRLCSLCAVPIAFLHQAIQQGRWCPADRQDHVLCLLLWSCRLLCLFLEVRAIISKIRNVNANTFRLSFHVISNLNPTVSKIANRLDYCGIVILMWSASIASIHFAFVCHLTLRSVHWFLVSGVLTTALTVTDKCLRYPQVRAFA